MRCATTAYSGLSSLLHRHTPDSYTIDGRFARPLLCVNSTARNTPTQLTYGKRITSLSAHETAAKTRNAGIKASPWRISILPRIFSDGHAILTTVIALLTITVRYYRRSSQFLCSYYLYVYFVYIQFISHA